MADEALLDELLSLWHREAEQGRDLSATELCRDHPGLVTDLQKGIQAVRLMKDLHRAVDGTLTYRMRVSQQEVLPPAAAPPPAVPGYEIQGELGRGGMGVVYQARQLGLNRVVALKMILAGGHAGPDELARFKTEAEAVARLQHPNIVQIHEVGQHEGRPFFSLEFCPGGSLEKQLDGTPLLPREAARLVEVLARAMQAAHDKGVIHRDLKPANVLLAEDGTPKITDFGLAKKLDEAGQTVTGAVMGTPSYMAPEQAEGKKGAVGAAADVYALGAILYECLTGRPPFKAATVLDTLKQVVSDEPVPPRQLHSRTPRDIETVCLKCLQKEPAKRYASAQDLAEDLRRFQAGEPIRARPVGPVERGWRWCRRNPVVATLAASLSAVVLGSLIALTALWLRADGERKQAEHERDLTAAARNEALANLHQANRNFQLAQESVDRNFTEVSEETLLNEPGFQPLRKRLLQGSRDFYQRFIEQRQGDPALRGGLAAAYQRLAKMTFAIDAKEEAITHQREAVRLYEALWEEDHDNATVQENLARAYSDLGAFCLQLDQVGPAEGALRRSLDLGEQLVAAHPNSPTHLAEMLPVLNGLGLLHLKKGNYGESEKLLTRAREVVRALAAANHESATGVIAATCLTNLGGLFNQTRRPEQAVPLLEQVRSQLSESMKQRPDTLDVADALAACLANLGVAYRAVGRANDAEKTYLQTEDILKELTAKNPSVTGYHLDRASNLYNLGNVYRTSGRLPKAEECYKQAQAMQERLVADYPSLAHAKRDLSETYTNLAVIYAHLGRRDEAERMYQKNLETREQLCKEYPATLDFQVLLAKTLGNVAVFYFEGGQVKEAEAAYRRKIAIFERLIKNHPQNTDYECSLGLTYNNLGRLYRPAGRTTEAEAAYLQALAIQEKLVRENPKVGDYRVDVATTQNNLGNLYRQMGRKDKAEAYYRTAIRGHESLVHDYPKTPYYARELARSYNGLAGLLSTAGRMSDAEPLVRQAADVLGKLAESEPREVAYRYERAESLLNLSEIFNHTKRYAEAEAVCKELLPLLEPLARENPKFVMLTGLLGSAQRQMGEAVAGPGCDPGEAVRWYGRAIDTLNDAARKAPGDVQIREVLSPALEERSIEYLKLARASAALDDLDRAVKLSSKRAVILTLVRWAARILARDHAGTAARADELAGQPKASAFLAYNAACANARSAAVVREDQRLGGAEKDRLSERYATRALEWLRKARAAGYFRQAGAVEAIKTESDLAPLRGRDDFKKWLSES